MFARCNTVFQLSSIINLAHFKAFLYFQCLLILIYFMLSVQSIRLHKSYTYIRIIIHKIKTVIVRLTFAIPTSILPHD